MKTKSFLPNKKIYVIGLILILFVAVIYFFQQVVLPSAINTTVNKSMDAALSSLESTDFTNANTTPISQFITNDGAVISINSNTGIVNIDSQGTTQAVTGNLLSLGSLPVMDVQSETDPETQKTGTIISLKSTNSEPEKYELHVPTEKAAGINVNIGAGIVSMDLSNSLTEYVWTNIGAGKVNVSFSNKLSVEAEISVGTGSIHLNIPGNIGANIMFPQGVPNNLSLGSDFITTEQGFKSINYDDSQLKAEISIGQGLGDFSVNLID